MSDLNRTTQISHRNAAGRRLDEIDQWRDEIEERTQNGETCKQIAEALAAKGVTVSSKTISRRRVDWGLRKRVFRLGYSPERTPSHRPRVPRELAPGEQPCLVGKKNDVYRKAEIARLTEEGKTADEIVTILGDQGVEFKAGAKTVWRLQTYWKLIPYDDDRARGRGLYKKKAPPKPRLSQQVAADRVSGSSNVLHYPSNCSFGPQKRRRVSSPYAQGQLDGSAVNTDDPIRIGSSEPDPELDVNAIPSPSSEDYRPSTPDTTAALAQTQQHLQNLSQAGGRRLAPRHTTPYTMARSRATESETQPTYQPRPEPAVVHSMDLMSAEILVDLATTSLAAAQRLKELLLAAQLQRPAPDSMGVLPPTAEDIATAKRKFLEATKVAIDLALDEPEV